MYAELRDLPEEVERAALQSPTLIIVGPVVALSPGWEWCHSSGRALHVPAADGWGVGAAAAPPPMPSPLIGLEATVGLLDAAAGARHAGAQWPALH